MIRTLYCWSIVGLLSLSALHGGEAYLRPAPTVSLPTHIDGNSSAFWRDGKLHLFSSTGNPLMISTADNVLGPWSSREVDVTRQNHMPAWAEASWMEEDGVLLIWYHHEPGNVCGGKLTAPQIGAAISYDNGQTIQDLGIVLESRYAPNCNAKNGFFAGGHGDFSVVLDREKRFFYFYFTNYSGPAGEQGVAVARLPYEKRLTPVGNLAKLFEGEWKEAGLGGRVSPIYPVIKEWEAEDADSFWGPSVHWNRYLACYVMLLNHACCQPGWPQEGIYISYNADPANPKAWSKPVKIADTAALPVMPGYYPQVMGLETGDTDTLAGEVARLFVQGASEWEIVFRKEGRSEPEPEPDPEVPPQEESVRKSGKRAP